ncbi:MAG: T9SS type A sorting domain-containing protein, partial [Candidatus Krumholzibacteria bacterium]|nr:T9SS type A sorting domain-containing protein [Candidatus Krumholzibacteria bacterium]
LYADGDFSVFGEGEGDRAIVYKVETVSAFKPGDRLRIEWALVFGKSREMLLRNARRACETFAGAIDEHGRAYRWIVPARKATRREFEIGLAALWVQGRRQRAASIELPPDLETEEVEWLSMGGLRIFSHEQAGSRIIVPIDPSIVQKGETVRIEGQLTDGTIFTARLGRELLRACELENALEPGRLPENSMKLYPNPFITELNIGLRIYEPSTFRGWSVGAKAKGMSSVRIYDVQGRLVRTIIEEEFLHPGDYTLAWDGLDDYGAEIAPGVYYCKLQLGARSITKRVILLR